MKRPFSFSCLVFGLTLISCLPYSWASGISDSFMCGSLPFDLFHADQEDLRRFKRLDADVGDPFVVRLIYFVPSDGPSRAEVPAQMDAAIKQAQAFFADQMAAYGYGRKTFIFEADSAGTAIVHRVTGQFPDSHYLGDTIDILVAEIGEQFSVWDNIYLIAVEISSGKLYKDFTGVGFPRGPNGGMAFAARSSLSFELVAHELGHAFGMPHDFRDDSYLMSYGSNKTLLSPCTAEFLDASRFFTPDGAFVDGADTEIRVTSPLEYPAGASSMTIRFELSDSDGLHQAQLLPETLPPHAAAGSFEVKECADLGGATDTIVEFSYDGRPASGEDVNLSDPFVHRLALSVLDVQGVATWKRFTIFADSVWGIGTTYFVATTGSDSSDGSEAFPFATIQKGIDTTSHGDTVIVNDGTYRGEGNVNLDFEGKAITVRSVHGAAVTIIDYEQAENTRGFRFGEGETHFSVLDGFTIQNGRRESGGGILCWESSPTITNCTVTGNTADTNGGGIYSASSSAPSIINCTLTGNSAGYGGGIQCWRSAPTITNCTVTGNTADINGGGIYSAFSSAPTITTCTITGNSAQWGGGTMCWESSSVVKNTILWGNIATSLGNEVFLGTGSSIHLTFSDVQGGFAALRGDLTAVANSIYENNINADPLFLDATSGDYYLSAENPCIDAGTADGAPDVDIQGHPRPFGKGIDIGAYERVAVPLPGGGIWGDATMLGGFFAIQWDC